MNIHSPHKVETQKISRTKCILTSLLLHDKSILLLVFLSENIRLWPPACDTWGSSLLNVWGRAKEWRAGAKPRSMTSQVFVGSCLNPKGRPTRSFEHHSVSVCLCLSLLLLHLCCSLSLSPYVCTHTPTYVCTHTRTHPAAFRTTGLTGRSKLYQVFAGSLAPLITTLCVSAPQEFGIPGQTIPCFPSPFQGCP